MTYIFKSTWHPVIHVIRIGDVDLVVLMLAGKTIFAMALDVFRQAVPWGHGGATQRPELATR